MPISFIPPMECLPVKKLPEGPEWVYELKLDGYRAQAIREANGVPTVKTSASVFHFLLKLSLVQSCPTR